MSQDSLYDWIAHQDCLPQPEEGNYIDIVPIGSNVPMKCQFTHSVIKARLAEERAFHVNFCGQICERLGEGDALDLLLRDEFMRRKFNLHGRAL